MVSKTLLAKLLLIACVGGAVIGHYLLHQFSIPAETALRLSEATMMADGARPYVDFWDNASPFCLYLNLVPVLVSRLISVHPIVITNILTALSFMLSAGALALLSEVAARRNALIASFWSVLLALVLVTLLQPVHFSQADQLFFLALFPYIVCRACTVRSLSVTRRLAITIGACLGLVALTDPLYCFYLLAFESCLFLGFFPFSNRRFILRRYLGTELKALAVFLAIILTTWLLLPSSLTHQYLSVIIRLNYYSFCYPLVTLNYNGTASDSRPSIFLAAFLLIAAMPGARQSILVRLFGIASLLGLGLMVIQGGTLLYQTYLLVGFAAMALAASLGRRESRHNQMILQRLRLLQPGSFKLRAHLTLLLVASTTLVLALGAYLLELALLPRSQRFDLRALGYVGLADRRDLGIFSEMVEEFSKPRQPVAILGLGVRPAYPLITQLRRKPGLSLTWGFPIDILNILEEPIHMKEMAEVKEFKKKLYERLANELSAKSEAPVLVLIDGDEVRRTLEEQGVIQSLNDNYAESGGVAVLDPANKDGHPPLEYVGYRSAFTIYRHK